MKVFRSIAAGLTVGVLLGACSSSRQSASTSGTDGVASRWQSKPLVIDGSDADWVKPLPYVVREEKVSYSISNDAQNLYILLSTGDRQEQQKIIEGGMSVWVNTKGEKSNGDAVGIGYPLNQHNDRDQNLMEEAQPQRYQGNKEVALDQKKSYALYGFNGDSAIHSYTYGNNNPVGVQMRLDYNNKGDMVYEAAIPLQALYPGAQATYSMHDLAVGIFINGLPPNAKIPREGGGGRGMGFGVGGGMGGFGPGMGMGMGVAHEFGAGGRRVNRTLFDDAQIWEKVQLARK